MPVLKTAETKRLYLVSTENEPNEDDRAWVEVKTSLTAGDALALNDGSTGIEQTLVGMANFVTAWNYTEEDGTPTLITPENIRKLDIADFNQLGEALADTLGTNKESQLDDETKKASSATLPQ